MYIVALCLSLQCLIADITPEALAIAACESGDTVTMGSHSVSAVNVNVDASVDTGIWQFNSHYVWSVESPWAIASVAQKYGMSAESFIKRWPSAKNAPIDVQWEMYKFLWDDGRGAFHWSASETCWKGLLDEYRITNQNQVSTRH